MKDILSLTFEEYGRMVESFHGNMAPGIMIGGYMVDLACRSLPEGGFYDVICETTSCLPDAVQLLTPCSIGNQWLKVIDVGRFALTFYDKRTGEGLRVYLDHGKLDRWPEIRGWFLKRIPKQEQDRDRLIREIGDAGSDLCGTEHVMVQEYALGKKKKGRIGICPSCDEAYPESLGAICPACRGGILPYRSGTAGARKGVPGLIA